MVREKAFAKGGNRMKPAVTRIVGHADSRRKGAAGMDPSQEKAQRRQSAIGVAGGAGAFLIWGLSPVYWKLLSGVPALEIIMHRIVWSFVFLIPLVLLSGQRNAFLSVLADPKRMGVLLATSTLVAANWLIYIWAVNSGHVLQASLGYYINPLINVLLGTLFLKERLRRLQTIAVLLATAGVVYLGATYGTFPWISICLALSFGCYGLVRKVARVGAMVGLAVETLLLSLPAIIYLLHVGMAGRGAFLHHGIGMDATLMGASLVTAVPLLLFTIGTRRLNLSTVGFLQYIAPTGMFLLGVLVYGEPFSSVQIVTFCLIWCALAIYTADAVSIYQRGTPG
jgi:chloramphenicol-sensitive protein RarD